MRVFETSALLALLAIGFTAGCRGNANSGPATVEVTGTVTLAGNPVEKAIVVFSPGLGSNDGRLASQATTDASGRFQLSTHVGGGKYKSGIVPGKYDVAITKLDTAAAAKNPYTAPPNLLPKKYADPKTSQLKADVAADKPNDFQFPLKND